MADESGLQGIDCVSKFADESFLTTTTTQIVEGIYDEQKLFRVSFPNLEVLDLLEQHHSYSQSLEEEYGLRQPFASGLLSVAQIVDE